MLGWPGPDAARGVPMPPAVPRCHPRSPDAARGAPKLPADPDATREALYSLYPYPTLLIRRMDASIPGPLRRQI